MAATARLEVRVRPEEKARLEHAAALTREPLSEFVRAAAEERAAEVLRQHEAATVVPATYFDDLLSALDSATVGNPALIRAAQRVDDVVKRA